MPGKVCEGQEDQANETHKIPAPHHRLTLTPSPFTHIPEHPEKESGATHTPLIDSLQEIVMSLHDGIRIHKLLERRTKGIRSIMKSQGKTPQATSCVTITVLR